MNKVRKNKKRKGFTLIELIAVMAILAILGAILIPRILGYRARAQKSNLQASAKTIVNAIQAYNADKTTTAADAALTAGDKISDDNKVSAAIGIVNNENQTINTASPTYTKLSGLTVKELVNVADNNFKADANGTPSDYDTATGSIDE